MIGSGIGYYTTLPVLVYSVFLSSSLYFKKRDQNSLELSLDGTRYEYAMRAILFQLQTHTFLCIIVLPSRDLIIL